MRLSRREFVALPAAAAAAPPLFSVALLADVQYADKADLRARRYRAALGKLKECAALLRRESARFLIHLGDLIDEGPADLDAVLAALHGVPLPRFHVLGNHDAQVDRRAVMARLGLPRGYYEFVTMGWRFIILDGTAVDARSQTGAVLLDALRAAGAPQAEEWNGALGEEQRGFLRASLEAARLRRQRVALFCHWPVAAGACRPNHLLWDADEVCAILDGSPAVAAWFNGHDHAGGYALRNGVHHVTLPGLVEHPASEACCVLDVHTGHLTLRRAGQTSGRDLPLPPL